MFDICLTCIAAGTCHSIVLIFSALTVGADYLFCCSGCVFFYLSISISILPTYRDTVWCCPIHVYVCSPNHLYDIVLTFQTMLHFSKSVNFSATKLASECNTILILVLSCSVLCFSDRRGACCFSVSRLQGLSSASP